MTNQEKDALAFATYIRARIEDAFEDWLNKEHEELVKGTGSGDRPVGLLSWGRGHQKSGRP